MKNKFIRFGLSLLLVAGMLLASCRPLSDTSSNTNPSVTAASPAGTAKATPATVHDNDVVVLAEMFTGEW